MTPYEIEVLLHYHYKTEDHPDLRRRPPVWTPTINYFIKTRLLEPEIALGGCCYRITEKGTYYVTEGLCKVPLPRAHWTLTPRPE